MGPIIAAEKPTRENFSPPIATEFNFHSWWAWIWIASQIGDPAEVGLQSIITMEYIFMSCAKCFKWFGLCRVMTFYCLDKVIWEKCWDAVDGRRWDYCVIANRFDLHNPLIESFVKALMKNVKFRATIVASTPSNLFRKLLFLGNSQRQRQAEYFTSRLSSASRSRPGNGETQ